MHKNSKIKVSNINSRKITKNKLKGQEKMLKISIFTTFLIIFNIYNSLSQEIKCDVTVNMDQVGFEARNFVGSLEKDLESYINNQKFSDDDWEGDPIPVDFQIVLSGGTKNIFSARISINSRRILDGPSEVPSSSLALRLFDDDWQFEYNNGANLSFNPMRYDKFTSLVDYYMLLIIGFDMDTYQANGGDKAFNKARNIALNAGTAGAKGFETNKQASEFNKYNLVNELSDMRYSEVRRLIFAYYVNGLDKIGFNREAGLKELKNILLDMAEYKRNKLINHSLLLQVFFETKAPEIAEYFNGLKDEEFFGQLMFLDPSNTIIYTQSRDGKYAK